MNKWLKGLIAVGVIGAIGVGTYFAVPAIMDKSWSEIFNIDHETPVEKSKLTLNTNGNLTFICSDEKGNTYTEEELEAKEWQGEKLTFTLAPNDGYFLTSVKVNNEDVVLEHGMFTITLNNDTTIEIVVEEDMDDALISQLDSIMSELVPMQKELKHYQDQCTILNNKQDELNVEIMILTNQMMSAEPTEIVEINRQIEEKKSKIDEFDIEISTNLREISILRSEVYSLQTDANSLAFQLNFDNELYISLLKGEIRNITIEDLGDITEIKPYAFYGCTNLTIIEIPSTVTSIGQYAFYNCPNFYEMHLFSSNPPTVSDAIASDPVDYYVDSEFVDEYESTPGWWQDHSENIFTIVEDEITSDLLHSTNIV